MLRRASAFKPGSDWWMHMTSTKTGVRHCQQIRVTIVTKVPPTIPQMPNLSCWAHKQKKSVDFFSSIRDHIIPKFKFSSIGDHLLPKV